MSEEKAPESDATDAHALVHRIEAGDKAAEAELVSRYGERLAFLLRRWTRDPDHAQDLFQETFRLAIEKLRRGELRQPERLAAYLVSLAKNLATYHYRKSDRRAVHHEDLDPRVEVAAPSASVLDHLEMRQKAELVRQVLTELPNARDREILTRFYLADQERGEICSALGLAKSHFKRVLFRARQRYRQRLESHFTDPASA